MWLTADGDTLSENATAWGRASALDDVSNQACARNDLAITSGMKKDAGYVIQAA